MKKYLLFTSAILLAIMNTLWAFGNGKLQLENPTRINNLSNRRTLTIAKDKFGFIWIGTYDGLNLYDGYSTKIFKHSSKDSTTISGNIIFKLLIDSKNRLWICSTNGVDLLDIATHKIQRLDTKVLGTHSAQSITETPNGEILIMNVENVYKINTEKLIVEEFLSEKLNLHEYIKVGLTEIFADSQNNLWIGTTDDGILKIDLDNFNYVHYNKSEFSDADVSLELITDFFEDSDGTVWFAAKDNLLYCRSSQNIIKPITANEMWKKKYEVSLINCIDEYKNDLYIGTTNGILRVNKSDFSTNRVFDEHESEYSKISTEDFVIDSEGFVWVGGSNIAYYFNLNPKPFLSYKHNPNFKNSISHDMVATLTEDNGTIWIGTAGGGLNHFIEEEQKFIHYRNDLNDKTSISSDIILASIMDNENNLWFGSYTGGLSKFDKRTNRFINFKHDENDPNSISNNVVFSIIEDRNSNIWVATNGGGVCKLINKDTGEFKRYTHSQQSSENSIISNYCVTLLEDKEGLIWVGTYNGISIINPENDKIKNISPYELNKSLNSGIWILALGNYKNDKILIGTNFGLLIYDKELETISRLEDSHPLSDKYITNIIPYNDEIWVGATTGLYKLNDLKVVQHFTEKDGLPLNEIFRNSGLVLSDGRLAFGTNDGFTIFHPDSVSKTKRKTSIIITSMEHSGDEKELVLYQTSKSSEEKVIELSYSDSRYISINYTSTDYSNESKVSFIYQMIGLSNDWINVKGSRSAKFQDISPGEYIFNVSTIVGEDIANNQASVTIIVSPPFWLSWWAFVGYIFFFFCVLYLYNRYYMNVQNLKTELHLKELEKKNIEEMEEMKTRFYSNVSHELKTPITLIKTPLNQIISEGKVNGQNVQKFKVMKRSADRLTRLINEVADFSRLGEGKLSYLPTIVEINAFIRRILDTFEPMAEEKLIKLSLISSQENLFVSIDKEKLDTIIFNLLSNSFKFTPKNGEISIYIDKVEDLLSIKVKDNGYGIDEKVIPHIFDRYYTYDNDLHNNKEGVGIGLALTKELVELHNGRIRVESEINKGTVFSITMPLSENKHYEIDEVLPNENEDESSSFGSFSATLLILDDDPALLAFLKKELKKDYKIYSAENGKLGLEIAKEVLPDLIISDINMSPLDGIELCKQIKDNELTCHIPVILLTAEKREEVYLVGFEAGADMYITKPFSMDILEARIRSLLKIRDRLRERFSRELLMKPLNIAIETRDEKLLRNAIDIVGENISNSDFNVDQFAKELAISRSQLQRKLKAVTGESPSEFIMSVKIQRAMQLLTESDFSISSICYEVGFNHPSHFSRQFQSKTGLLPKEYRKKNTKK